jgi:hypothetical protein
MEWSEAAGFDVPDVVASQDGESVSRNGATGTSFAIRGTSLFVGAPCSLMHCCTSIQPGVWMSLFPSGRCGRPSHASLAQRGLDRAMVTSEPADLGRPHRQRRAVDHYAPSVQTSQLSTSQSSQSQVSCTLSPPRRGRRKRQSYN